MKLFIKTLLFLSFFSTLYCNAQVADTLAYVKSFESNKTNYIGKPFSKLLNEMTQLQPISIWTTSKYHSGLNFCTMEESTNIDTVNMIIIWQIPIPFSESEYYDKKNHFYFTNDERNFYGSKIVKDIYVRVTK